MGNTVFKIGGLSSTAPCWRCGRKPVVEYMDTGEWRITCSKGHGGASTRLTLYVAIQKWNEINEEALK